MNSKDREVTDIEDKHKSFFELNQQTFMELLTFVDFADERLNIGLVEINFAQDRDIVIETLINHPQCQDIQFELLDLSDPNIRFIRDEIVEALQQVKIATNKKLVLLIKGLEKSIGAWQAYPDVLTNLNFIRDELRTSIPHPILFFLPEYAINRLAKYAPDFWAWNRKVFTFKSVESTLDKLIDHDTLDDRSVISLNLPEKQKRIDLLLRLLSEYSSDYENNSKHNLANIINIYSQLGNAYRILGKYPKSIDYFQHQLKIAKNIGDHNRIAQSLNNLGVVYRSLGEYEQAIDFHQQSLEIAREIGNKRREANSLGNLGNVYDSLGEYEQAIDFHQQSLQIEQKIGNKLGEAQSLNNLGIVYDSLGEYEQAIDSHQQSLQIKQQISYKLGEAQSLNNLGIVYDSLGKYEQAIDFHQQSLQIKHQIGDKLGEAQSLNNLGIVYDSLGEYEQAIDFHQQSLQIEQQIGDKPGEAISWFNLGNTWRKLEKKSEAQQAYNKAKKLFQAIGLDDDVEKCDRAIEDLE